MKKTIIIFSIWFVSASALAESFLTAQQFPKTFEDLSFASRIEVLREGYKPFEVKYDDNGVCVSGCAYHGITIKEDMEAVDEATAEMADLIANSDENSVPPHNNNGTTPPTNIPPENELYATDWCRNGKSTNLPLRYPVDMSGFKYKITSDFGFRKLNSGSSFHPAIDIGVPNGTPVYATADGVVDKVWWDDYGGGNVIDIKHSDGIITQYLHLSQQLVSPGQTVRACDKIALSGNTGHSEGPHLDYRIRFNSDKNKYIDMLCPCRIADKKTNSSGSNTLNMSCVHSLFFAPYKFVSYNPNSNETKRSIWRVEHGHCMSNVYDLLPDEAR